jgi:hypothetical protein
MEAIKKATTSKTRTNANTFLIGGVEIEVGRIYVLDHKFDALAPEGSLRKIEATKYPFARCGAMNVVLYDDDRRMFDTGFYESSHCLSQIKELEEKKVLVGVYNKKIKEPMEQHMAADLSPTSDFWKTYRFEAYANKTYDTSDIKDLFDLFHVINQGVACEKGERNPFWNNAPFIVTSPIKIKNKKKEQTATKMKAITVLGTMADADKDTLDLILEYIGRDSTDKIKGEDLKLIYFEVFNDEKSGVKIAEDFMNTYEKINTPEGKIELEYYYAVNKLFKYRKITKGRRGFTTDSGEFLGNTLKDVANFCLNPTTNVAKIVEELINQNPQVRRQDK